MKIKNRLELISIAVCCLVASLWSEAQCMDPPIMDDLNVRSKSIITITSSDCKNENKDFFSELSPDIKMYIRSFIYKLYLSDDSIIKLINFHDNGIGNNGMGQITSLNLSSNKNEYKEVIESLKNCILISLNSLNLSENQIGLKKFLVGSIYNSKAEENLIKRDETRLYNKMLESLSNINFLNLTYLDLHNNCIGDKEADALLKDKFCNLTFLDLSKNEIGCGNKNNPGTGLTGVRAVTKLKNLTFLDLSKNSIGNNGAEVLRKAKSLSKIKFLNLSENIYFDDWEVKEKLEKKFEGLVVLDNDSSD